MKTLFFFATFLPLLALTCKHKQQVATNSFNGDSIAAAKTDTTSKKSEPSRIAPKTKGKVSHEFASNGCAVVIVVHLENGEEQILIPRTSLEKEFDKDGLEIFFNYHPLKMRQPPGCEKGIPAEITDVSLK